MTVDELVIADLAAENAELRERLQTVESNLLVYRELTVAAVDALHDLTVTLDCERAQHARVREAYRALREHLLLEGAA